MMDNPCANIFSTHVTVYGSHSVKFAYIERDSIFLQVNPHFILCFILLVICLSFHTCSDVFVECFKKDRCILIKTFYLLLATSRLGVLDWDLWYIGHFIVYGHYVVCVFCHGLPKGEIVRFWVCNVGKPWQNMTKTKSY